MNRNTLIVALCFFSFSLSGQGVKWQPDISQALAKAKEEGKLLFVEAYLPTCPACQAVEPNFLKAEVATKYNTNFVNYKLNLSIEGARKFLDERKITMPSFPQFLFFDGDGKLVHQGEVSPSPASINAVADDAINPNQWSSNFANRFNRGDRDFGFLVKYGVYSRLTMDTLGNQKAADALFEIFPKEDLGTETSWAATKKVVTSVDNGFFKYWIEHIPAAAAYEKKGGHAGQEMNTLGGIVQSTLFSKEPRSYNTPKLTLMRTYMDKIGATQYADSYLWEHEVNAKIREGKKEEGLVIGKNMAQKFGGNGASLIFITKVFNDNFPDNSYLPLAQEWLKKSKPQLKENNHLAEYFYEAARVDLKLNDKIKAKTNIQEAIKYAKLAKADTKKFEALQSSL